MKLLVKRLYCWGCRQLVNGREQTDKSNTSVLCSKCGRLLWVWNGITWKAIHK